ncbi:ABC transporter G family member [Paramyrothecium foliicola]|nr:ABC transporter G family member [Paramyrothecium foliicola]
MDPLSVAGLAVGVASIGLQVFTGCMQGIQLLVTALGYEDECKYLNLRLRMEQHRLYTWSEASGLLDVDEKNHERILNSNVFNLHRQTVLDLLVQIQCLFNEFTDHQRRHNHLKTIKDDDGVLQAPEQDAKLANFPMADRKRDFIKKTMATFISKSQDGWVRLRWSTMDKEAFENLLAKFSILNDSITQILDHSVQVEIRNTLQDTNRGVLLLHHKIADLSHLVLALKSQLDSGTPLGHSRMSKLEREANADALRQLSRLAQFKAFNETVDPKSGPPAHVDQEAARFMGLANSSQHRNLWIPRYLIELGDDVDESDAPRCEALMKTPEVKKKIWIEWKDYDTAGQLPGSLSKEDMVDRVRKLAALLNHSPKPEAFRTPHCLGFFDKADPNIPTEDVDILDRRLGLVFERPGGDEFHTSLPPVSLRELLLDKGIRKPRVTDRIKLAHALSNCLLYLHAVNWLHKGLRSHNVLFFRTRSGHIDYHKPYLSGFDFSRPGGSDEMTDVPGDDAEHDLYRHPNAQANRRKERERSKKSFDIYSLGVIYVELAHWRPVEDVVGVDLRRARGNSSLVRRVRELLLAEEQVADIGAGMGEKFEAAARACLTGGEELGLAAGDDETVDEVAEKLSMRFYEDVVKKLEGIVLTKSGTMKHDGNGADPEWGPGDEHHLLNTSVKNITWTGVTVTVKDRETKEPRAIVGNVDGIVEAGEICALMGPSGCGKTTLLNVLARRPTNASDVAATVLVNGSKLSRSAFRAITCFVEQEDALIGSLTVRETLEFSSRLARTRFVSSPFLRKERLRRINGLLQSFGLTDQANIIIGTPIRKGISGGQKRRVGVASQLITSPKILFLDEPTSGLDSAASWEVIKYLKEVARRNNLIVICSIHQPSTSTFNLFDKLLLLSEGRTHYFGPVDRVLSHFEDQGLEIPQHTNPAEFLLETVNIDFASDKHAAALRLNDSYESWKQSAAASRLKADIESAEKQYEQLDPEDSHRKPGVLSLTLTLLHRSFVKSYRDVVAYGIRLAMYTGLAIMMGTVWVRLAPEQASIQPFINAIFFGSAFMSFMAVAYVPAFLEDRQQYVKEHHNGLYGALELVVSNFLIGIPYLFIIAIVFSVISYWLSNFQPTATAFFTWVMWLFLDLLAAESLVVLMTSLFPSFVISLALVAFANGLWMSVGGFMVPPTILNVFYKYVFHYWDYQKYVFEGMMVNEFAERNYSCGSGCQCMYQSPLADECQIAGQAVLDQYGYKTGHTGRNVGIMLSIIFGYRLAAWVVLKLRR